MVVVSKRSGGREDIFAVGFEEAIEGCRRSRGVSRWSPVSSMGSIDQVSVLLERRGRGGISLNKLSRIDVKLQVRDRDLQIPILGGGLCVFGDGRCMEMTGFTQVNMSKGEFRQISDDIDEEGGLECRDARYGGGGC